MTEFRDHLDLAAFRTAANPNARDFAALHDILAPAVETQMTDLLAAGTLKPAADLGAREIRFIASWNALVADTANNWRRRDVNSMLTDYAAAITIFARDAEHALLLLEHLFDEGVSPTENDGIWRSIEANDLTTGERGEIRIENFQPSFWVFDLTNEHGHRRAEPLAPLEPVSAQFTAPSGELLFTDTLRLGHFSESIDFEPNREYGELSLNSATGRQAHTVAHAEDHNFGFVQTTNTCVAIHRNDTTGALLITERWNEDLQIDTSGNYTDEIHLTGWANLGGISCDIWRVTAIDRSVADALIDPADPVAGGKHLDDYLAGTASYSDNVVSVPVEAGSTWRITCGERFDEVIDRATLGLPDGLQVWALYEQIA